MKSKNALILCLLLSLGGIGNALAYGYGHGYYGRGGGYYGHGYGWGGGVGVTIGPYWGPWGYYGSPYYPPVVVEQAGPQVYIEQQGAQITPAPVVAAPSPETNFWYYCRSSKGYYPYVKECPGGWQKVAPLPPNQQ
jgi:hypothetical protein